jgi:hypothetical protein
MIEQRTGETDRRKAAQERAEVEVSSFPQNIAALEAIIGKMEAEFSSLAPKVDRLAIYQSDVQSMLEEVKAQQARAIAANGSADRDVQRLQLLLSTRVAGIVEKVDQYLRNSRDKLGVLQYQADAIDPAAAELADILAGRHESAKSPRDRVEDVALVARGLADFISSNPGSKPGLEPILDKLLTISLHGLVERRAQSLREPPRPTVDSPSNTEQDTPMTVPNREEIDAKLETIEARMDGRVAAIQASIDGFMGRLEERALRTDERFTRIEESQRDTQASLGNLKTTIIVTALSTVLAIVIGVAAFNATVLSNMVASFESGKNTAVAQAEVKRQSEETAALLREIQAKVQTPPPTPAEQKKQ